MLSSVKRALIILFFLTIGGFLGLYFYTNNRTFYNKDEEIGNTAGNIYNGGLFCQQGNTIYFNYLSEDSFLYSMNATGDNFKRISDKNAVYINADGHYLYYVLANNTSKKNTSLMPFGNSGVYRIFQNGTGMEFYTGDPSAYLMLKGNYLYYQRYNVQDGPTLFRNKIDHKEEKLLYKKPAVPAAKINDTFLFTGTQEDLSIGYINLLSFTSHTQFKGSYKFPIYFGDYIYYIDVKDKNRIYRMNADGSEPTLLINKACSTYNITNSGKYLYYQVNGTKKDGLYRLNLDTMKSKLIKKGDYKYINVTENFVFFISSKQDKMYKIVADGNTKVSTFRFNLDPTPTADPATVKASNPNAAVTQNPAPTTQADQSPTPAAGS